ncbi:PepSY domain-containing protein [Streptomyces sp. NPDC014685]|uniref:PepSY domain-containing protein n=1 Tax=Streptomyces sp. NPDC014685 TaxID=3364881 RepID=UPI0036F6A89D
MKSLERAPVGRRRTVAAVLAATAAIGGAAATAAASPSDAGSGVRTGVVAALPGTDNDDNDDALIKNAKVDIKQAAEAAEKSVAGTVTAADLDGSMDKPVWKIDVTASDGTEHEVTVDATTGKVTATRTDKDQDPDDRSYDAALAKSAKTDLAKAVDAALDEVSGTATSAGLEKDHGTTPAWHIDVTNPKDKDQGRDHEVTVDATTGKVTAVRTDEEDNGRNADDRSGAVRLPA